MCECRIRNFNAQSDQFANKSKRTIANERAGKKAGFAQNLETVAGAEHELSRAGIVYYCFHDWRETRDCAATQIIAVGKTSRQNDRIVVSKRSFFVPDIIRLQPFDAVDAGNAVLIAI